MNTIKILDPVDCTLSDSFFGISGGDSLCGEWVFNCLVAVSLEDNDADLWQHKFNANIYMEGYGSYVTRGPDVWTKSAVAYVTGKDKAFDLHTALRPFLSACVFDALLVGYHIVGTYRHDGREWNLSLLDSPDALELPDFTI